MFKNKHEFFRRQQNKTRSRFTACSRTYDRICLNTVQTNNQPNFSQHALTVWLIPKRRFRYALKRINVYVFMRIRVCFT